MVPQYNLEPCSHYNLGYFDCLLNYTKGPMEKSYNMFIEGTMECCVQKGSWISTRVVGFSGHMSKVSPLPNVLKPRSLHNAKRSMENTSHALCITFSMLFWPQCHNHKFLMQVQVKITLAKVIKSDIKGVLQDGHPIINNVDPHKILISALPDTVEDICHRQATTINQVAHVVNPIVRRKFP